VEELAGAVAMDPSAVSQQLGILRQLRFVVAERAGRRMRYRLHDEHVAELLAAVRHYHAHAGPRLGGAARGTRFRRARHLGDPRGATRARQTSGRSGSSKRSSAREPSHARSPGRSRPRAARPLDHALAEGLRAVGLALGVLSAAAGGRP
jgi:hypothetical protein